MTINFFGNPNIWEIVLDNEESYQLLSLTLSVIHFKLLKGILEQEL